MKKLHLIKNYAIRHHKQAGMTLIELTVVLLVLIGLAGLLIPYVSGFVSKTHDSTGTNNLAALNGNFARFENEYMRAPDNLESLVQLTAGSATAPKTNCQGTAANSIYCGMMTTNFWEAAQLSTANVMSLNSAGIQTVLDMDPETTNATFASTTGAPRALTANGWVAKVGCANDATGAAVTGAACTDALKAEHLADAFGGQSTSYNTTCYDYYGFGVGDGNEMIGRTMNSAPIHFASNGDMAAAQRYNRFVAVYRVDKSNASGCSSSTEPAKFIGSAMSMAAMSGHLWGVGHSAGHAYENLANNN